VHLKPGPSNSIADVAGVRVGSAEDRRAATGVSVVLAPGCVAAGVSAPGGLGTASLDLGGGITVGALVAVNCVGSVRAPGGGFWAAAFELDGEAGGGPLPARGALDPAPTDSRLPRLATPGAATTIAVVAASAALSPAQARRVAIMAQDGIARAVRPAHTPFDGDVVFALALPGPEADAGQVARIGSAAADVLARAIARGVWAAVQATG
jgi:L-aminopeptidase/D-esterase-like protein